MDNNKIIIIIKFNFYFIFYTVFNLLNQFNVKRLLE